MVGCTPFGRQTGRMPTPGIGTPRES